MVTIEHALFLAIRGLSARWRMLKMVNGGAGSDNVRLHSSVWRAKGCSCPALARVLFYGSQSQHTSQNAWMGKVQSYQQRVGRQVGQTIFAKSLQRLNKRVRVSHSLCGEPIRFELMPPAPIIRDDADQNGRGPDQDQKKCQTNINRRCCYTEGRKDFRAIYEEGSDEKQQQKI
jgi:hypothetical protein